MAPGYSAQLREAGLTGRISKSDEEGFFSIENEDHYLGRFKVNEQGNIISLYLENTEDAESVSAFPEGIYNLTSLEYLGIDFWSNFSLSEKIGNFENLKELYLFSSNIKEVPEEVSELSKLEKLTLGNNCLRSLPESMANLKSLTYLDLSDNYFKEIPESILRIKPLEYLNMSDNYLTSIPEGISELTNLRELHISNESMGEIYALNLFFEFPKSILELKSLEVLNLERTGIKELPEDIKGLINLSELDISGNRIEELPYTKRFLRERDKKLRIECNNNPLNKRSKSLANNFKPNWRKSEQKIIIYAEEY